MADRLHTAGWKVALVSGASAIGGGSAPGIELPTVLIAVELPGASADVVEQRLRGLDPPLIARIEADRVVLDLRTVLPEQDERLGQMLVNLRGER
jgi:L-seryl-tRNA(Ser) seleniumtransferase